MKRSSMVSLAVLASAAALVLAGCSGNGDNNSKSGSAAKASSKTACVILPDAASSPRWEGMDRPDLKQALESAGFKTDIQNAQGDTSKYATIADQELSKGCGVMLLVDYNGAGVSVAKKAKAQGIPVIAYDRPIAGADYYVSFDNEKVGELEGQAIVDGLKAEGKDPATATVVYMGGDPTDGNAKMFHDGAAEVMTAAGIKPAKEPPGVWDGAKSATNFEQALTALGGKVDAVWVANDTNAAGVISVLDKNNLKVPVSGQDASTEGLQNVLLGKQTGTVWKHVPDEAKAASDLAIQLLKGQKPSVDKKLDDGTPYIAVTPVLVGPKDVEKVVQAGDAKASDLCTGAVAAACATYGVK
ncbi:sugar ABC transporter substrate-binding protein [Gryllotalpicola protaetiae]|uniref:Sugar ABC transporter substrate-binding protein n=1 Tax=Gryllotalpicola protaetiae TaxID=2419771 RepID=A0A387BW23_9MICO|nr:substrate-binding domain-containing protein [Gryllotalpicola protaetiae]AYG05109.1 sugar ABC transporter substrate-binding protein [Gryllotalpicola protaetiae]